MSWKFHVIWGGVVNAGLIHVRQTIVQNAALEEYYGADLAADADVIKYRSDICLYRYSQLTYYVLITGQHAKTILTVPWDNLEQVPRGEEEQAYNFKSRDVQWPVFI